MKSVIGLCIRPLIAFALSLGLLLPAYGQLQPCFTAGGGASESFMGGAYVEVGISRCGSYGTACAPPAGYHPNAALPGLGFVADAARDGWATGSPNYCGDYFVPGTPLEGWAVQYNGVVSSNHNTGSGMCNSFDVPGSVTAYGFTGGIYETDWSGSVTHAGQTVTIDQKTRLPDSVVYFITELIICNTSGTDITDFYYLRHLDPDNDQPWSGSYVTTNTIVSQPTVSPTGDALCNGTRWNIRMFYRTRCT